MIRKRKNITDRAHRYRANSPKNRPLGPKVCAVKIGGKVCGSRRNIVPHHKNGNPSDTRRGNLIWACKSCNTRIGKEHARKGIGRRTKQAAVGHTRGAHDAGGKIIHETPKGKRRAFAREIWFRRAHKNPTYPRSITLDGFRVEESYPGRFKVFTHGGSVSPTLTSKKKVQEWIAWIKRSGGKKNPGGSAEDLYRKFHGRGPDKSYDILIPVSDPYSEHPELAQLGKLLSLYVGEGVKMTGPLGIVAKSIPEAEIEPWIRVIKFDGKQPDVAGEPGGTQIYFAGGNQDIDSMLSELGADPRKDLLDLGFCYRIEYMTTKKFDQFRPTDYWHLFGEETGVQPRLLYDKAHKLLILAGGEYVIRPEGIVN